MLRLLSDLTATQTSLSDRKSVRRPSLTRSESLPKIRPSSSQASITTITSESKQKAPAWLQKLEKLDSFQQLSYNQESEKVRERLDGIRSKAALKHALRTLIWYLQNQGLSELELFQRTDKDGNGFIDKNEMKRLFQSLGCNLSAVEIDAILRAFGGDYSREIDFNEFSLLLKAEAGVCPNPQTAEELKSLELLCGFQIGDRVKIAVCISNDWLQEDPYREKKQVRGIVRGPGKRKGTLFVELEENGRILMLKQEHLRNCCPPAKPGFH